MCFEKAVADLTRLSEEFGGDRDYDAIASNSFERGAPTPAGMLFTVDENGVIVPSLPSASFSVSALGVVTPVQFEVSASRREPAIECVEGSASWCTMATAMAPAVTKLAGPGEKIPNWDQVDWQPEVKVRSVRRETGVYQLKKVTLQFKLQTFTVYRNTYVESRKGILLSEFLKDPIIFQTFSTGTPGTSGPPDHAYGLGESLQDHEVNKHSEAYEWYFNRFAGRMLSGKPGSIRPPDSWPGAWEPKPIEVEANVSHATTRSEADEEFTVAVKTALGDEVVNYLYSVATQVSTFRVDVPVCEDELDPTRSWAFPGFMKQYYEDPYINSQLQVSPTQSRCIAATCKLISSHFDQTVRATPATIRVLP
jgi:hypothetical protein